MDESIAASRLKAKCSEVLDRVARQKKCLIITRRGKPIARLVPIEEQESLPLFGSLQGTVTFSGDVLAPIDVDWEALR